jgi:hypothetical protein
VWHSIRADSLGRSLIADNSDDIQPAGEAATTGGFPNDYSPAAESEEQPPEACADDDSHSRPALAPDEGLETNAVQDDEPQGLVISQRHVMKPQKKGKRRQKEFSIFEDSAPECSVPEVAPTTEPCLQDYALCEELDSMVIVDVLPLRLAPQLKHALLPPAGPLPDMGLTQCWRVNETPLPWKKPQQ